MIEATPLQSSVAVAVPVLAGRIEAVQSMLVLAGQVMLGPCVSVTVIVWSQVLKLPQLSVAFQVRVMTWLPAQLPGASESVEVMLATPLQSSTAVAVPVAAGSVEEVQLTVVSGGQVMTGGVVSVTVITLSQVLLLPQLSSAFQVRVMTWLPAQLPGASESVEVMLATPLQSSTAVAVPVAAGSVEEVQLTVVLAGQVMTGGVVSVTMIT